MVEPLPGLGLHSCCAGEANSCQNKKVRMMLNEALCRITHIMGQASHGPLLFGLGFCEISNSQKGKTALEGPSSFRETAEPTPHFSQCPCPLYVLTPCLPDTRSHSQGPAGTGGLKL
jgi:hypothetical protein